MAFESHMMDVSASLDAEIYDTLRTFLGINPRLRFWKGYNFVCWKSLNTIQLYVCNLFLFLKSKTSQQNEKKSVMIAISVLTIDFKGETDTYFPIRKRINSNNEMPKMFKQCFWYFIPCTVGIYKIYLCHCKWHLGNYASEKTPKPWHADETYNLDLNPKPLPKNPVFYWIFDLILSILFFSDSHFFTVNASYLFRCPVLFNFLLLKAWDC